MKEQHGETKHSVKRRKKEIHNISKLTAIVNWKVPEDTLALVGFLGLTGWFRDLILRYAKRNSHYETYYGRSRCRKNTPRQSTEE